MACCVPLSPYKDLKISLFGVPKTSPLRDKQEKVLDVSFQTNSKVCRYHFKKEDVVDTWKSGAGLNKYTVSKIIFIIYIFVIQFHAEYSYKFIFFRYV